MENIEIRKKITISYPPPPLRLCCFFQATFCGATKYMCIADLVKSKNEFPQRCNKKAALFFTLVYFLYHNLL